ncbi:hypothetical protein ABH995_000764 [Bradyrhizobium yuanmingense]
MPGLTISPARLRVVFQALHKEKPYEATKQFVKVKSISIETSTAPLQ